MWMHLCSAAVKQIRQADEAVNNSTNHDDAFETIGTTYDILSQVGQQSLYWKSKTFSKERLCTTAS